MLILGGVGFIGRNFVKFLRERNLCSRIRVADKSHWQTSQLNAAHTEAFQDKALVQFIQADLSKDAGIAKAFEGGGFDYIFNLCGETRFGLAEAEYKLKCLDTATKIAAAAAKIGGCKKFVEMSSAQVYDAGKKASTESDKLKPWTEQAKNRLAAEEAVRAVQGLPVVVLRPALVYGSGDLTSLAPRICCASVYQKLNEKMKFLWSKELKLNTVHVKDVCNALWCCATSAQPGSIYNLSDPGDTDQGMLNDLLGALFGIETGFQGSIISNLAKINMADTAETVNDKHVPTWNELCKAAGILNTPLSPYIDKELLYNNSLGVDGSKIVNDKIGFNYEFPKLTAALLREQIQEYIDNKVFPATLKP